MDSRDWFWLLAAIICGQGSPFLGVALYWSLLDSLLLQVCRCALDDWVGLRGVNLWSEEPRGIMGSSSSKADGLRCWTCENDSKQPYAYGNEPLCIPDQQKMPELPDWAYQGQCISAENFACVSIYRNKEDDTPIRRLCTKTRIGNGCHKNAELNGIATSGFACLCRANLCNFRKNNTNRIIHFPSDKGPIGTLGADLVADTATNANAHQPITSLPPSPDRDPRNFPGWDPNEEEQQAVTTTARTEPEAGDRPPADSANGRKNITKFFDFSPALPQPARSSSGGSGNPKFTQNSVSRFISVFSVACAPVFRKF